MTGSGRATWGEQFMTWDLDLEAQALSFTTLARSYPALPLRGTYRGPLRVRGTIENLGTLTNRGTLVNASGAVLHNSGNISNDAFYEAAGTFINNGSVTGTGTFAQTAGSSQINGNLTQREVTIQGGQLFGTGSLAAAESAPGKLVFRVIFHASKPFNWTESTW